jgi:hypothetical protein
MGDGVRGVELVALGGDNLAAPSYITFRFRSTLRSSMSNNITNNVTLNTDSVELHRKRQTGTSLLAISFGPSTQIRDLQHGLNTTKLYAPVRCRSHSHPHRWFLHRPHDNSGQDI